MALLDLLEISKSYETKKILEGVDFFINEGDRIAIIGKNGGGKSTLLKLIDGSLEPDYGRRILQNGITVEMLSQHSEFNPEDRVIDGIKKELSSLYEAQKEYEDVLTKLSKDFSNQELIKEQNRLISFLDAHDAWNLDEKIKRVLEEFNLLDLQDRPIALLSGGEQKRVSLSSVILKKPEILLLDEPTNHLDIDMVRFLEELLKKEKYTTVFISHDRYFIDEVATKGVEIDNFKLHHFMGGYRNFLADKERRLNSLQKEHEGLLKLLKSEEEWLNRGVKARLKRDEGRKKRVLQMREMAKSKPGELKKMEIELSRAKPAFTQKSSSNRQKMLFEIEDISISLGNKNLIKNFTIRILQNDKIAIVGKNGSGKTTFLKLLLNELKPDSGVIKKGDFQIGYFDQHRSILNDEKNLLETFCPNGGDRVNVRGSNMHVYGYMKKFLFPKEDLAKKIGDLSGGEKNRVALALLFTKELNCLILDEPTNDLDIETINILEEALLHFDGAVIFVSHDRYFVDKIAKKLFIFEGNGKIIESYKSYIEHLEDEEEKKELHSLLDYSSSKMVQKEEFKSKTKPKKLSYKEEKDYNELPEQIEILEKEISFLTSCLEDPKCYQERGIEALYEELSLKEAKLEPLLERYYELEEKVLSLEL